MPSLTDTLWATKTLTTPGALVAKMSNCAFWVARYRDREDVHEWDVDWSECPKQGMVELRLVCPNGRILVLGSTAPDMTGRFFQLKVATRGSAGIVLPDSRVSFRPTTAAQVQAHLIGRLDDIHGRCTVHAWEPKWELRYKEPYDDTRPQDFQEPANDGSGGIKWKPAKTITEKHKGRTVEERHCRIEAGPDRSICLIGYHDNAMTGLSQDVLGIKAD